MQDVKLTIKIEEMPKKLISKRLAIVHKKRELVEDLNYLKRKQKDALTPSVVIP